MVLMLIGSALVLLGPRAGAGLAFPLGYMLFLVPFGEELVAPMQMVTRKAMMRVGTARRSAGSAINSR